MMADENPSCWDADRLDLSRVGIVPSEQFMSTKVGKEMAKWNEKK